ncbi:hypothetical protein GLOTRDRAFT_93135 [Gloeophyllum trabeum ATCC 11539]|uniref:Uncharacterized protein n=1 Tax=Gloeophyllum trabeum (strain ATCC 11539 / FP-39264 / Madison 617) TaxID=670483 RepID=S7Q7T3_GLOTA|nr:uncharacterized protein GLOTRDRAFT_93135 [Gloeophyllum trabeum ATCC 11539]EPQ55503.1 hypothetical protein GLOTRDRAFT_93135 [Gloeophyllum trabeum ATCC 11539]
MCRGSVHVGAPTRDGDAATAALTGGGESGTGSTNEGREGSRATPDVVFRQQKESSELLRSDSAYEIQGTTASEIPRTGLTQRPESASDNPATSIDASVIIKASTMAMTLMTCAHDHGGTTAKTRISPVVGDVTSNRSRKIIRTPYPTQYQCVSASTPRALYVVIVHQFSYLSLSVQTTRQSFTSTTPSPLLEDRTKFAMKLFEYERRLFKGICGRSLDRIFRRIRLDSVTARNLNDIDERIAQVEQDLLILKRERNKLLPVARLPDELALRIINQAWADAAHSQPTFLVQITHVCNHWRELALRSPLLWARVPLYNKRYVSMAMERSSECQHPTSNPLFMKLKGKKAPQLESLTLSAPISFYDMPLPVFSKLEYPRLREVDACNFNTKSSSRYFVPSLTSLSISESFLNPSDLLSILHSLPQLEDLRLDLLVPARPQRDHDLLAQAQLPPMEMPNLRHLFVKAELTPCSIILVNLASLPVVTEVEVVVLDGDPLRILQQRRDGQKPITISQRGAKRRDDRSDADGDSKEMMQTVSEILLPPSLEYLQVKTPLASAEWRRQFGHLANVTRLCVSGADDGFFHALSGIHDLATGIDGEKEREGLEGWSSTEPDTMRLFPRLQHLMIEEDDNSLYDDVWVKKLAKMLGSRKTNGSEVERLDIRGLEECSGQYEALLRDASREVTLRPPLEIHVQEESEQ